MKNYQLLAILRKLLPIIMMAVCTLTSHAKEFSSVPRSKNVELVRVLNASVLLAQLEDDPSVKIYELVSEGECAEANPTMCPKVKAYVAVSETGEYVERAVFVIDCFFGCEFLGWTHGDLLTEVPKRAGGAFQEWKLGHDREASFYLERTHIKKIYKRYVYATEIIKVTVTSKRAWFRPLKSNENWQEKLIQSGGR